MELVSSIEEYNENTIVQLGFSGTPSASMSASDLKAPSAHISDSEIFSRMRFKVFLTKTSCYKWWAKYVVFFGNSPNPVKMHM